MIKNTLCILILFLIGNVVTGQHILLDNKKGIKKIENYNSKGELTKIRYYNTDGNIIKREMKYKHNQRDIREYLYEGDKVIMIANLTDCKSATDIFIKKDGNKITITDKKHNGKYKFHPCKEMTYYMKDEFYTFNGDSLFSNVPYSLKVDENTAYVTIYEFKDLESKKEYISYSYPKRDKYNNCSLLYINSVIRNGKEGYIHRRFESVDGGKYLTRQNIIDKNGSLIRHLGIKKLVEPTNEVSNKYEYEYDEKNNWIQQFVFSEKGKVLNAERKIEYYK